jgi:hypothetical protein
MDIRELKKEIGKELENFTTSSLPFYTGYHIALEKVLNLINSKEGERPCLCNNCIHFGGYLNLSSGKKVYCLNPEESRVRSLPANICFSYIEIISEGE